MDAAGRAFHDVGPKLRFGAGGFSARMLAGCDGISKKKRLRGMTREEAQRRAAELRAGRLHPVRFTPGIFMAPLTTRTKPPATTTNCLIVGEERLLVVDPGAVDPAELERLFREIDVRVEVGAHLDGVLITHHHPDHSGGVAVLCERYSVPVWAHADALDRLDPRPATGHAIDEGDVLPLGTAPDGAAGWQLEVLHTPGHCADHLAFVESRYRSLIAGDLVSALSTVMIDPDEGHMGTYLHTLERLAASDIATVYPGHGPAVRDGRALLAGTLAHRRRREEKLAAALTDTPRSADELLAAVYNDVDPGVLHLAGRSLLAGLMKLEEDGRATRDGERWRRR